MAEKSFVCSLNCVCERESVSDRVVLLDDYYH